MFRQNSRYTYGKSLSDVLRNILRFNNPITIKNAETFLKSGRKIIKDSDTVKNVIKFTLKPFDCLIMQQNIIKKKFNCIFAYHTIIQTGAPIKFTVKTVNEFYQYLNNSRCILLLNSPK